MEAITALGIAGNAVQFIDFGEKFCSMAQEIYHSATGSTQVVAEMELLAKTFVESIETLSEDLIQYGNALSQSSQSEPDSIQKVVMECKELAKELLGLLEKLRPKGKRTRWQSFVTTIKSMWMEKDLKDLQARLANLRAELEWNILLSLRKSIHWLGSRQKDQFGELQASMTESLTEAIRSQMSILPQWPLEFQEALEKIHEDAALQIRLEHERPGAQLIEAEPILKPALKNSSNRAEKPADFRIDVSIAEKYATKLASTEAAVLESLSYLVMWDREEDIAPAELATFEWIFDKPRNIDRPWSSFLEWLEGGQGIYWIRGKAGSGKSTMMKHVLHHQTTKKTLQSWSGKTDLIVPGFFFWNKGNDLQKSQAGLLRSLLYECLKGRRELIPLVLPDAPSNSLVGYWTLPRLKAAFTRLVEQEVVPLKICLFVDGLDEYSGEHADIADLFKFTSCHSHVKFCLSSRPLLVFERAFQQCPRLDLQNLTFDDIQIYVRNKLNSHERIEEIELEEPQIAARLASEIVAKASGVFLWVKLVVRSLLDGLGNFDRGCDLERRLDDLPEDLEDLYWYIIERVKPSWYLEEGFRQLLLVKSAIFGLTVFQLFLADTQMKDMMTRYENNQLNDEVFSRQCVGLVGRIKTRSLGMIEISGDSGIDGKDIGNRRITFLHKSVADFLETPKMQDRIAACLGKQNFTPHIKLMRAGLLELKMARLCFATAFSEPNPQELKRKAWFDEIRPVVSECMAYAQLAEKENQQSVSNLLSELDRVAEMLWNSVTFKSEDERTGKIHWSAVSQIPPGSLINTNDKTRDAMRSPAHKMFDFVESTESPSGSLSDSYPDLFQFQTNSDDDTEAIDFPSQVMHWPEHSDDDLSSYSGDLSFIPSRPRSLNTDLKPSNNGADHAERSLKVVQFNEACLEGGADAGYIAQTFTRKQQLLEEHWNSFNLETPLKRSLVVGPYLEPASWTSFTQFANLFGLQFTAA